MSVPLESSVINVDGEIFSGPGAFQKATVSVFDRSFLYGDSLYEVARTYRGKPFGLSEHWDRLWESARLCKMDLPFGRDHLEAETLRTLDVFQRNFPGTETYIRVVVSRGIGKIGFAVQNLQSPPTVVLLLQPLEPPTKKAYQKGMRLRISERLRNPPEALTPAMKSGNYLNSLLAFLEAQEKGDEDAILCNSEGFLTEGTTFNLFYVKNNVLHTSPFEIGILDGITRRLLIAAARKNGLGVRVVRFPPDRLFSADAVFVTSTIREVFPVGSMDGKRLFKEGAPPAIVKKLLALFRAEVSHTLKLPLKEGPGEC